MIHPEWRSVVAISLGAIAGALSRYYLGIWVTQRFVSAFPWGTFLINVSGCLAMGIVATLATMLSGRFHPELRLMLAVGFLGSFTTFSTFGLDTLNLFRAGRPILAWIYGLGSVGVGVLGVQLGVWLAQYLAPPT